MCTVSMIGDHYRDKWKDQPWFPGGIQTPAAPFPQPPYPNQTVVVSPVSRLEFEILRKEVEDMKALLKRAKEYDERNGEPDCEIDEKMDLLRRVAKMVGVDLEDVVGKAKA